MIDPKMLDALSSSIYLSKLQLKGETVDDDDKRIRASGLYDDWSAGAHAVGQIYNAVGRPGSVTRHTTTQRTRTSCPAPLRGSHSTAPSTAEVRRPPGPGWLPPTPRTSTGTAST